MTKKERVPLQEQLEELEEEQWRRHRIYPELVAKGHMRQQISQMKQERLAAAIATIDWLIANTDLIRDFRTYKASLIGKPSAEEMNEQEEATLSAGVAADEKPTE